ncbi:conserved hypothetical protein [Candidatus Terasakiella magnetica]|nr:conserved hypothetical protein [Candidatus Terasakiella magnetica]
MRYFIALILLVGLGGCALTPPDQPAYFSRMGRFMGLVANCGCSDITPERMIAEYPKVVAGLYSEAEIKGMRGYVDLAATERWPNIAIICAETCSQRCMVQSVVGPLGGRGMGVGACLVNERDLHLTSGQEVGSSPGGRD